jgi:hypothetical protein
MSRKNQVEYISYSVIIAHDSLSAPSMNKTDGTTVAVSDLKKHAGFWLRFVSNHVSHAFARQLVPALAELADRNDEEFFHALSAAERERWLLL